ncbi:MAG: hybrid sensor histidine kinase/response regulator [Hyphomicrobiales bacterium]|nr:hybrid sensor histidine kinase/response regulator [Hyphomicrobiales bacterium]
MTITAEIFGRSVTGRPEDIVARLIKINAALVERLENRIDQQASAFSLFQTAIGLEGQVRERTMELKKALTDLEQSNVALVSAKDAAEKANLSKTRFLAAAGHDLLQPLYAAQLSISTLAEVQTRDENGALCRQIERALSTIEAYLRSILDISKLDAGVVTPDFESVGLSDMFQSLDGDFRGLAEKRGLKLRFRATKLAVESDPILLRRILQNLVSNALRYTARGGVLIAARTRGANVRIDVLDTGVGVQETEKEKIFEEFHRSAVATQDTGEGLGLGLSIVRRMSSALGHTIDMRSHPGRGSRFSVIATAADVAAPKGADLAMIDSFVRANALAGRTLLLIENDVDVLAATKGLLMQWGAHVLTARDLAGVRAVFAKAVVAPEAVVADYHLDHGETGLQAIALARSLARHDIPSVIVTADQSDAALADARAAGYEMLRKPVKPAQLRAVLTHLI